MLYMSCEVTRIDEGGVGINLSTCSKSQRHTHTRVLQIRNSVHAGTDDNSNQLEIDHTGCQRAITITSPNKSKHEIWQ